MTCQVSQQTSLKTHISVTFCGTTLSILTMSPLDVTVVVEDIKKVDGPLIKVESDSDSESDIVKIDYPDDEKDRELTRLKKELAKVAKENVKLKENVEKKEEELNEICKKMLNLEIIVEEKERNCSRKFAEKTINPYKCLKGDPETCAGIALKEIKNRKKDTFYLGATSFPDTRCQYHIRKNKFETMHIIFETRNLLDAMIFEDRMIKAMFWDPGCTNKKKSTCGLAPNKGIYYIYYMQ